MKDHRLFSCMAWGPTKAFPTHGFWFRVCGYGLHVSSKKPGDALFSERYGYRKALYVFGLRFEVLRP